MVLRFPRPSASAPVARGRPAIHGLRGPRASTTAPRTEPRPTPGQDRRSGPRHRRVAARKNTRATTPPQRPKAQPDPEMRPSSWRAPSSGSRELSSSAPINASTRSTRTGAGRACSARRATDRPPRRHRAEHPARLARPPRVHDRAHATARPRPRHEHLSTSSNVEKLVVVALRARPDRVRTRTAGRCAWFAAAGIESAVRRWAKCAGRPSGRPTRRLPTRHPGPER